MKRKILSAAAVAGFVLLAASLVSIAQPVTTGGGLSRVNVDGSGGLVGSGWTTNPLSIRKDCGAGSGLTWDGNSWECGTLGGIDGTGSTNAVAKWSDADTLTTGSLTDTGSVVTSTVPIDVNNGWVWASQGFYSSSGGPGLVATDQHDVSFASVLEFWPTVANVNVTGVTGGNAATSTIIRYLVVRNIDTGGNTITIVHQSASSTTSNRFNLPNATNIVLGQREARLFAYNQNIDRWEMVGSSGGGGGGVSDGDKGDITVSSSGTVWDIDSGVIGATELADNLDLSSNGSTTVGNFRGTVLITANLGSGVTNDWNPTNLNTATILDVQTGASDSTITSIAGGSNGRVLILFYRDSQTVTIDCNASTGTAANRIICPGFDGDDIVMTPSSAFAGTQGSSVTLVYSGSLSRWIVTSIASAYIPTLRVSGAATIGTTLVIGASAHNFDATGYTTTGNIGAGDADADRLDIYAHPYTHGTAPTLSSCGTSPTISGNDKAGVVTMGSGSPSACTLTFNQAWTTNAPICTLAMNTNTRGLFVYVNAVSTSALTVEWANSAGTVSACNGGCIFYYQCVGRL